MSVSVPTVGASEKQSQMDRQKGRDGLAGRTDILKAGLERLFSVRRTEQATKDRVGLISGDREVAADSGVPKSLDISRPRSSGLYPASLAQRQLWFLHRLDPKDDAYHIALSLRLTGHLDASALQTALQSVVDRHDALRTVFSEEQGALVLHTSSDTRASLVREDLSALRDEARERKASESAESFFRRPFDLGAEPPLRSLLIRLSDREHLFFVVAHHIAVDGGSLSQFARQLSDYYCQQVRQGRIRWKPLQGRSALWGLEERRFLESPEASPMLEYWSRELADFSPALRWPFPLPERGTGEPGGLGSLRIAPEASLSRALMAYERQDSGRLFRFLLASWFSLIHRLTGEEAITIGVPVHDRRHNDEREMIGLRMKLVPVTIRFSDGARFSDVLKQLNVKFRETLKNLRVPIGSLPDLLQQDRIHPGDRLFHTYFNYREDPYGSVRFEGLKSEEYPVSAKGAKSDLSIIVEGVPGHERWMQDGILFKFDRERLTDEDVRSLVSRWFMLMAQLLRTPDLPLADASILLNGEEERLSQLETSGDPGDAPSACLHELFREQAAKTPERTAVVCDGIAIDYAELDRRSDRLALRLASAGVGRDVCVAVRCGRGIGQVVAMLGVLKAGGAFLPFDPRDPSDRVRALTDESGVRFLVVDGLLHGVDIDGVETVHLDADSPEASDSEAMPTDALPLRCDPASLAYVMFTSGSTGRPKGVMVEHRNIVNRILFVRRFLSIGPDDRTLFKSSPSFDVSLGEVFLPLVSGGAVVIPGQADVLEQRSIADLVCRHRVTYLHFVPSMLGAFLEGGFRAEVDESLRVVWCGGESLSGDLLRRFLSVSRARLVHGYGPTEAAVGVTVWDCVADHPSAQPPIGRPVDNTVIRIVDEKGRRLPPGMAGEVWIGGAQVARGYLGDGPLTVERFPADPLASSSRLRFYRSGDRGAWLPDGNLQYLGRLDGQLKIRGQRVEPEETTAVLMRQPGVRQAYVAGESDPSGSLRLAAWVKADGPEFEGVTALHKRIYASLPSHLLPSVIRLVEEWPLDQRGKTDVSALRRMSESAPDRRILTGVHPSHQAAVVRGIWQEVLGSSSLEAEDDFFRSGGHSLLALRLVALMKERLGLDMRLSDFYRNPGLSSLVEWADGRLRSSSLPVLTDLPIKAPTQGPVAMSHAQRRFWLLEATGRSPSAYNLLRIVPIPEGVGTRKVERALLLIAQRHAVLRTRLFAEGDRLLQDVVPLDSLPSLLNEPSLPEERHADYLAEERDRIFDLSSAPLWRASLLRNKGRSLLVFVFHHVVADARSMEIFHSDLESMLSDGDEASEDESEDATWTYRDFAHTQTSAFDTDAKRESLEFWRKRLSSLGAVQGLEPDMPMRMHMRARTEETRIDIEGSSAAALEAFAKSEGVSLANVILAGFGALLGRVGGNSDVVVGMSVSERQRPEWQGVMGFFLNTLPMRISVDSNIGFRSLCRRLKWELEEAIYHSGLPYEEIVSAAGIEGNETVRRLSSVMFNMHDPGNEEGGPWWRHDLHPSSTSFARHDLACHVRKTGASIAVRWVYDASLFSRSRMEAMIRRYTQLLDRLVDDPDLPLGLHPILLDGEAAALGQYDPGETSAGYAHATLHSLVSAAAASDSERTAVVMGGHRIRFGELDELSDRIARTFTSMGIGRGEPVGVVALRCIELPAVLLGIVKAGAAFMPFDNAEPIVRLRKTAGMTGMRHLVVPDGNKDPQVPGLMVIDMRKLLVEAGNHDEPIDLPEVSPTDPAYVIHTSGSTGVPKGAIVTHANLCVRLMTVRDIFGLDNSDRSLVKTPMSFDVAVTEVFQTLVCGGSLAMAPAEDPVTPERIIDLVCSHGISYLHFTPARLRAFLDTPGVERVNGILKVVRCGGESLSKALMEECLDRLDARLFQSYGPAETAVSVTFWECRKTDDHPYPPIGRPHPGTVLRLLDANGMPVAPGTMGELLIGGTQVGLGYLNRPELTAERFVLDPVDAGNGLRFFRSGDLCRYTADGQLLFVGRLDDQAKVRGARVEPGEVSMALRECPGVSEAFVAAEPDGQGSSRLRAWVAMRQGEGFEESRVRNALAASVPEYMLPHRIHLVDSIPLTPHGKVDHQTLRSLTHEGDTMPEEAPLSTPTEMRLAAIWSQLLGAEVKSREADFFRLGGHSLQLMRLSVRIEEEFGVDVPVRELYGDRILHRLASRIDFGKQGVSTDKDTLPRPPLRKHEAAPMSYAQRRMWILQRLLPHPSSYHVAHILPVPKGCTEIDARSALQAMIVRHGILRTRLWEDAEGFWQKETHAEEWKLDWDVLQVGPGLDGSADLSEEMECPFDLAEGSCWRARWVVGHGDDPCLLLVFHHAVTDEWSMNLFRREFDALVSGRQTTYDLPEPRCTYADFSIWQHAFLSGGARETLEGYWRGRLSEIGTQSRLRPDFSSHGSMQGSIGSVTLVFDPSVRDAMAAYCRLEGLSRFSVWMSVWQILHSRLGNGEEVLLAAPVSERDRPEWQDVMGMFLNTLPIRARVDERIDFRSFTHNNHRQLVEDIEHGQLPYEDIIRLAGIDFGTDGPGLPQVMFAWHGEYEWSEGDVERSHAGPKARHAKNPITVHLTDRVDACHATLQYDADLFSENTAKTILLRLEAVARQVMTDPGILNSDIDILLPGERERLRELSGRDDRVDHPATTLHAIFRQTAARYPDRPAVIEADGRETSYAELKSRVFRIASFLRAHGIGKESVVAVHMQRNSSLLASMLGILEAGGVFFLMEPGVPSDRLRRMAEKSRVAAILTEAGMTVIPGFDDRSHRFEDMLCAGAGWYGEDTSEEGPGSLACVIFTSGSTGTPKGVMLEHVNLCNYLFFLRDAHGLGPEVRTLHRTALSFDPSLYELLLPMTTGGAVVMAAAGLENDAPHIVEMVERDQADYLFFTPAQLRHFLRHGGLERLNGTLRVVQCAGEALEEDLMEQCLSILNASLSNAYGPAEAGAATQWICHNGHPYPKPSIGRPNCNVDTWVMDPHGRPVPPGMPGELWIGGAQTGRGYIGNGEETKKRFVDDPLDPGSGRRYFRTGDLARFLPDGNLLFLGRIDDQLKVRGVRVEPGDVTSALLRCEGVRDAVVLAELDGEGSNRLRAWVTMKDGLVRNETQLRSSLLELLPGHMVPFRIHVIDSIPLTPHGKTDHPALRAIAEKAGDGTEGLPLATPTERGLAAIWSSLLGVDVRHRDADFFRLGGHSLSAIRLAGHISKQYGVALKIPDFYRYPGIGTMAARIDAERGSGGAAADSIPVCSTEEGQKVPMSGAQRRMWMLQRLLKTPSSYHIALLVDVPFGRTAAEVRKVMETIAARHAILRTRLWQDVDGFWQQAVPMSEWSMDWGEIHEYDPRGLDAALSVERERPFDLSKAGSWRARWVHARAPMVMLVFHHAIADEWSMNFFSRELAASLSDMATVEKTPVPTHTYADFAVWQHTAMSNGVRERLEGYWRERLSDLGTPVHIQPDKAVSEASLGLSGRMSADFGPALRIAMDEYCRREGLSRFAVWLSVWQALHSRLGLGEEVLVATPVSERVRPEWQDVMGMFLNTLPIRVRVDQSQSFLEFTRENHRTAAADLAHVELSYEDILRVADLRIVSGIQSLPQVVFALHTQEEWSEEEPRHDTLAPRSTYARNPLSLHLKEFVDTVVATLVYDSGQFLPETANALLQRFHAAARQLLSNPDMAVGEIDIMLPGELERVFELSGRDNRAFHQETALHEVFRRTAGLHPQNAAVVDVEGRTVSYRELGVQVGRIAAFLQKKGTGAGMTVAVHMHRGPALLASLLGILESGAAFLLMDPGMPMDRLLVMAGEADVAAVIAGEDMPPLPGWEERTLRFIEAIEQDGSRISFEAIESDPSSSACVLFTSGSTGTPKGVVLTHGNLSNYLSVVRDSYSFGAQDRTLQKTLLTFDACLVELLLPIFSGGAVVIPESGIEADMRGLSELAHRFGVTYMFFTPFQLKAFLDVPGIGRLNGSLRIVACGGEAMWDELISTCRETLAADLYQIYGPTETSIAVSQWKCRTDHGYPRPPIGRPNANVDLWIMDPLGRPVPHGVPGELWVGGAQTAKGYVNDTGETPLRFFDDPFELGSGRRYYRTGDLARFLPDGNLFFLGRLDEQAKVRGVRVEPGEVRSALLRCEGVKESIVVSEPDGEGSNRLRVWVVLEQGTTADEAGIRSALSRLLPLYMSPFRIHVVEKIPLTSHGKTDFAALRGNAGKDGVDTPFLPLSTPTEQILAVLWTEVLGVDVKSRDADFFSSGGHSLSLMRLMERIESQWGSKPDLSHMIGRPKLEWMARVIDGDAMEEAVSVGDDAIAPVQVWGGREGRQVYAFVGGAGSEEEFAKFHLLGRVLGEGWRIHILPDPETRKGEFPTIGMGELTERYGRRILSHCRRERVWLIGDCIGGIDAYAVAGWLQDAGVDVEGVVTMDTPAPEAPVLRLSSDDAGSRFFSLPVRRHKVLQAWFMFRMNISKWTRGLFHPIAKSREEVVTQAVAYGLFDPGSFAEGVSDCPMDVMRSFERHLESDVLRRAVPSGSFNAFRYRKNTPGFDIRSDSPVLHALFVGMCTRYVASKVFGYRVREKRKSDIMAARSYVRREAFKPGRFNGPLHLIRSRLMHLRNPTGGWERWHQGKLTAHAASGDHQSYLREDLQQTAAVLSDILNGRAKGETSRVDATDRRGKRSGGLQ